VLDKGFALAEEGHADQGLHWMLEALKTAPPQADAFRKLVRWNLGAWLRQVHRPIRFLEFGELTQGAVFTPDGRSFAAVSGGPVPSSTPVRLFELASGRQLTVFRDAYHLPRFTPDGKVLLADSQDRTSVLAVDVSSGQTLWSRPLQPAFGGFAWNADGSLFALLPHRYVYQEDGVFQWREIRTGQPRGEALRVGRPLAVSPDGRILAAERRIEGKAAVTLIELSSGRSIATWRSTGVLIVSLSFCPDGKSLIEVALEGSEANGNSYVSRFRDARTGQQVGPPIERTSISGYVPAGDRVVVNSGILDPTTRRALGCAFRGMSSIAIHPEGRLLLNVGGHGARLNEISHEAGPAIGARNADEGSWSGVHLRSDQRRSTRSFWAALRSDGRVAASVRTDSSGGESICFCDPATGRPIGIPARHRPGWLVRDLAFSPDGRTFATSSLPLKRVAGEVRLWDASTGRLRFPPIPHTNWIASIAFRPDGKVLAAGDYHGLVRFWDTSTGLEIGRPLPQGDFILKVSYSPDGKMLAVGLDGEATGSPGTKVWDLATRRQIGGLLAGHGPVRNPVFRPDSWALLAISGGSVRLWDPSRGTALGERIIAEDRGGFSPDGRLFLTTRERTVRVHDGSSAAILATLPPLASDAKCWAFQHDGSLLAVGCEDGSVRLIDQATWRPIGPPLVLRHSVHQVAFTADGRSVAAIDEYGESRTWTVPGPGPEMSLDELGLRIEARTGRRMEKGLTISLLDDSAWRERLEELGRLDPEAVRPDTDPAWHEPMVREAEQNGNAFAAFWHLDRLIAARPNDWYLYARRGRAWVASERFDKAVADFQEAQRLSSLEQVLDFQAHSVVDCTRTERWAEALWYLERLIAARPNDWALHADRAAIYGKLGRDPERQADLDRVFELGPDEGVVIPRAEELARAGRWAEAARLVRRCGRAGPLSQEGSWPGASLA
jgi:WD40 repeat protein